MLVVAFIFICDNNVIVNAREVVEAEELRQFGGRRKQFTSTSLVFFLSIKDEGDGGRRLSTPPTPNPS